MRQEFSQGAHSRLGPAAAAVLSAVLLGLQLLAAPARAYVVLHEPPASGFAMNLDLGASVVSTIQFGNTTWNAIASSALSVWNQVGVGTGQDHNFFSVRPPGVVGDPCARDGVNEVRWATTLCGLSFGSALAVTQAWLVNGKRVEEDVLFNQFYIWNAYSGPLLQNDTLDFYRVALHEFGHAAGLDHPNEAGQSVPALMNSRISNLDSLQADDVAGAHAIAWPPAVAEIKPDLLGFAKQTGVALNAVVTSNAVAVSGHGPSAPISVNGGEYSIDGGTFTNAPGTVSNGRSVTLRVAASGSHLTAATAILTIEGTRSEFSVLTGAGPAPVVANTSAYLPLGDGNSWTYEKNGAAGYTDTILPGSTLINGLSTKVRQNSEGDIVYLTNDGNGIRQHGEFDANSYVSGYGNVQSSATFIPPYVYASATATIGQGVSNSGTINVVIPQLSVNASLSYTGTSTPEAFEVVTVPSGTYNTIRIHATLSASGLVNGAPVSIANTDTLWVAENIGVVKEISVSDSSTDLYLMTGYNVPPDTLPDPFNFAPQTGVPLNALVVSNAITIYGINSPAGISVIGGEYSIDGGATWTSAPGNTTSSQPVYLRLTSAPTYSTARTATLTIGGVSGSFTATTMSPQFNNVTISGPTGVPEGATAQYTATANYSDGSTQPVSPQWSVVYGNAAASIDPVTGVLGAKQVASDQNVTLIANWYVPGGGSGATAFFLTVVNIPPPFTSLSVIGPSSLGQNASATYHALAGFADGSVAPVAPTWSLGGAGATLSNAGVLATATLAGQQTVTVTATYTALGATRNATRSVVLDENGAGNAFVPDLVQGFALLGNPFSAPINVAAAFGDPVSPVPGVTDKIDAVWRWNATLQKWQFYSPQLSTAQNTAYALANNFEVLTSVPAGDGYWVNAYAAFPLAMRSGAPFLYDASSFNARPHAWNLLSMGAMLTPAQFNAGLGTAQPPQVVPESFDSLWMWDPALSKWFFYAPSLAQPYSPISNAQYAAQYGLLDFATTGRALDPGAAFWVSRP